MSAIAVMPTRPGDSPETRRDAAWPFIFAAWLLAAASTAGALFLSEVVHVAPCSLCWYQRVFMFPLAVVLASGLMPLDLKVLRYAAPLVLLGWLVALYHVLLTVGVIPEQMAPCTQGIPCSRIEMQWFGFVTIPLLSLLSFSLIGLALAGARLRLKP